MQLEVGQIIEGKVTGFTAFGAFIDLDDGKRGMVHISEVASEFVKDIKDHLTVGQVVKVKILSIAEDGKISLSIKKAIEQPKQQFRPKNNNSVPRKGSANVWQGGKGGDSQPQTFESMMARFKQESDEKMSDLKRDAKHGGGFNRRGTNKL